MESSELTIICKDNKEVKINRIIADLCEHIKE